MQGQVEEGNWHIAWAPALVPDLALLPGDEVMCSGAGASLPREQRSLTATVKGTPSLLLCMSDPRLAEHGKKVTQPAKHEPAYKQRKRPNKKRRRTRQDVR